MSTNAKTQEKVDPHAKLEALWTELVAGQPTTQQVLDIVRVVEPLRQRAWKMYLESNPTERALLYLISDRYWRAIVEVPVMAVIERFPSEENLCAILSSFVIHDLCKSAAAIRLLEIRASNQGLLVILERCPSALLKDQAALMLLERNPERTTLRSVMCSILSGSTSNTAAKRLLDQNPGVDELWAVMRKSEMHAHRAWSMYKQIDPFDPSQLSGIVYGTEIPNAIRAEAAELILTQPPNVDMLISVMREFPEHRERAWKKTEGVTISNGRLSTIADYVPELRERALARIIPEERTTETVFGEIIAAHVSSHRRI